MDGFGSAGLGLDDPGVGPSLGLALKAGEGLWDCNGLTLFPKDKDRRGDCLDVTRFDGSFGLGAGEAAASTGVCVELRLGLGVAVSGEAGDFNEEAEDRVLIGNEDGGDEPKLIKVSGPPRPGSRSWLKLRSGGVWVTGKPVSEQESC